MINITVSNQNILKFGSTIKILIILINSFFVLIQKNDWTVLFEYFIIVNLVIKFDIYFSKFFIFFYKEYYFEKTYFYYLL